jgi:DNA-binding winged helix-turn-helix (wHTH) protein/TolB-like protein
MCAADRRQIFRFRDFELDLGAYELRRHGRRVRLERQPMELLILLVERRRQLVTRAEIVEHLWGRDVFVAVETGINTVVRKVRQALRDSPDAPAFVETVPGKGYRFIAPVEILAPPAPEPAQEPQRSSVDAAAVQPGPVETGVTVTAASRRRASRTLTAVLAILLAVAAAVGSLAILAGRPTSRVPSRVTVAVLPFTIAGSHPDRTHLAGSLAEDTSAALAQVEPERFSVIPLSSIVRANGTTRTVAEIGRELGAEYVVDGSIQGESDLLRVQSSLIRVTDGARIWTSVHDYEPRPMMEYQRQLSTKIAAQIRLELSAERLAAIGRRQTHHPEAYTQYLIGRSYWTQFRADSTPLAIRHYQQATSLDRDYALAWAGLADAYATSVINGDATPRVVAPLALDAARKAIAAQPDLADANSSMGFVNFFLHWKWNEAEKNFRAALVRDAGSELAHRVLGVLLAHMGRPADAAASMVRAREIAPLYPMVWALSAQVAFAGHDYPSAVRFAQQAIDIRPMFWIAHFQLAQALERTGDYPAALQALDRAALVNPGGNSKLTSLRGYILARQGRQHEAREVLQTIVTISAERYFPPYAAALVHAGLGERDEAFAWLDRAFEERDVHLIALPIDQKWDPFRSDPRFEALVRRCGFDRD